MPRLYSATATRCKMTVARCNPPQYVAPRRPTPPCPHLCHQATLVCLDSAGTPLERVWCLYEFDNTLALKVG